MFSRKTMLITLAGMLLVMIVLIVAIALNFTAQNPSSESFVWASGAISSITVLVAVRAELKG